MDVKKVEYDEVTLESDYKNLTVNSCEDDYKYEGYRIPIDKIFFVDKKGLHIHFNGKNASNQEIYALVSFHDEKEMIKWYYCLVFGKMI